MNLPPPHTLFAQPPGGLYDLSRPGVQFILAQPWFADQADERKARIAESVYTLQGAKGESILKAGEAVDGWYAVLNGLVKLQTQTAPERRQGYLGIPGGEWFGEGSVMKRDPRRYDVVALRDSELLCLPRSLFEEMQASSLSFNQALTHCLNMRLGQAMVIIETMRLRSPEQRVAMYLGPILWHGSRRIMLSQEELGILSGLSRQSVNGVLKQFERQGLVTLDFERIEIRDEKGLMALVFGALSPPTAQRR
jgi:CRP/FNR family transcriptional regulator, cyclic AMP receptor protein